MNIKYFAILLLVSASAAELIDPLGPAREKCRVRAHMTKAQLANSKHHLEKARDYLLCFVAELKIPTSERGELDVAVTVRVVRKVTPEALSRPITDCCNKIVAASGLKTPGDQIVLWGKCLVEKLSPPFFDLAGYLKKPEYAPLNNESWDD